MNFEWDAAKAAANVRKHGVSFEEAVSALKDDFARHSARSGTLHVRVSIYHVWSLRSRAIACRFTYGAQRFRSNQQCPLSNSNGKENRMKKAKLEANDWLRAEYKRRDLSQIARGKYARRMASESNIVVLDPLVSKAFPSGTAVNAALRGLLELAKASTRPTKRSTRARATAARAD
jgi:uncharacterized DUF497 family protein